MMHTTVQEEVRECIPQQYDPSYCEQVFSSSLLLRNDDFVLSHILGFVGTNQYRFIGTIDHRFHRLYNTFYLRSSSSNNKKTNGAKTTYYNLSTIQHVKICYNEISKKEQPILCYIAATQGNLPILQYLRSNGTPEMRCDWDQRTCHRAAIYGHVHILQWAKEQEDCPFDRWSCIQAIKNGHLSVLQWVHEHDQKQRKLSIDTITIGTNNNGNNSTLYQQFQHAYANIYSWESWICVYAAEYGQLEILQWWWWTIVVQQQQHEERNRNHNNNLKWNHKLVYEIATKMGHISILQWLSTLQ